MESFVNCVANAASGHPRKIRGRVGGGIVNGVANAAPGILEKFEDELRAEFS